MYQIEICIPGNVIAKKNNYRVLYKKRGGKKIPFILPGDAYVNWEQFALLHLMNQPKWSGSYPVKMHCFFYRATKQKFDFSNMLESIQDTLVKAGTIEDDSYRHVIPYVDGMEVDKEHPRTKITIIGEL